MRAGLLLRSIWATVPRAPPQLLLGQPVRHKRLYVGYAKPILIVSGEDVGPDDVRRFKSIEPAPKCLHSGSQYDPLVDKFTGQLMEKGHRELAREIMRCTFREIKYIQLQRLQNSKTDVELNPVKVLHQAVTNCTPVLILQPTSRGSFIYQVPAPPRTPDVARHIAVRFIIDSANEKAAKQRLWTSLARELVNAANGEGKAVRKTEELHKSCDENRAYANFRLC